MKSARNASRNLRNVEGRPSAAWLPGTLLGVLGIVLLVGGLLITSRDRAAESQTATALAQMRSNIWIVKSSSSAALLNQLGSMESFSEAMIALSASELILEKGGLLRNTDKVGVRPLSEIEGVNVASLRASLSQFMASARQFQDNSAGLTAAAQVINGEDDLIKGINDTLFSWRSFPQATIPQEVLAAANDVAKTPRATLEIWFPSNGTETSIQNDIVLSSQRHAKAALAAVDNSPPVQRVAASAFAENVAKWAKSLEALAASRPYRYQASKLWPDLSKQVQATDVAITEVQKMVDHSLDRWRIGDYVAIAGLVLAIIGIFWWVYIAWVSSTQQWTLSQDHMSALDVNNDIDALVRHLERIVNNQGEIISGEKLRNEDVSSQTFRLRGTINRLLESREAMANTAKGRLDDLFATLDFADIVLASASSLGSKRWEEAALEARRRAERIALLANSFGSARTNIVESQEVGSQAHDLVNKALRDTDGLRGDIQSGSKRVKRMGEVSQAIQMVADLLRSQLRRLHVLALNASIEAASMGPAGQAVVATAREMDGFIQNAVTAAASIDDHVVSLLDDAQEAIGAMERSSGALVSNSQLSSRAVSSLRSLDRLLEIHAAFIAGGVETTERQALDLVESQRQYTNTAISAETHEDRARTARDGVHRGKETLRMWGLELIERRRKL